MAVTNSTCVQAMAVSYCGLVIVIFILASGNVSIAEHESNKAARLVYNIFCDPQNSTEPPQILNCKNKTLKEIASEVKELKYRYVQISINTTQLLLNSNISFSNLTFLTINGAESDLTNIVCTASINASAGIVLSDIDSITLNNLKLTQCGSLIQSTFKENATFEFSSALTMVRCKNVQVNRLTIAQSKGIGLKILNHQEGTVNVKLAVFKENALPPDYIMNSNTPIFGGGGVYICLGEFQDNPDNVMLFQFENCTFENNTAHNKRFPYLFTNTLGELQEGFGEGGGVYLSIGYKTGIGNVYMSFLNCIFANNYAFVGGGLSVKVYGKIGKKTANVTVNVADSLFSHNGCRNDRSEYTHFGGGAYLSFNDLLEGSVIEKCHYRLSRVKFDGNCAKYGGGVILYYFSDRSKQMSVENSVFFDDCQFHHNTVFMGSAIDMTPSIFHKISTGYSVISTFKNCNFLENLVSSNKESRPQMHDWKTPGLGTIRTSLQDIYFQGHNCFENNWGTALYAVNAIVNFQNSSATFVNNTGLQGGAIALIESATMIMGPNTYDFHNNSAYYKGGAIYVLLIDNFDLTVSRSCFIQYTDDDCNDDNVEEDVDFHSANLCNKWKASITFTDNKVLCGTAGHSIYATSLYPCQVINNGSKYQPDFIVVNISDVFTVRGIEISDNETQYQVATDGTMFHVNSTPLMIIPGEEYRHGITVFDDLGQNASVLFRVVVHDPDQKRKLSDDVDASATFVGDEIQLMGSPNKTASLHLHTLSSRQNYIEVDVKLVKCPPGFILNKSRCICNDKAPVGIFKCDSDKFHSYLLPGYWVGLLPGAPTESSGLVTCTCPFCNYKLSASEFEVDLPRNYSDLNKAVCGDTRTGIVCGKCKHGYTVYFHSPNFLCKSIESVRCKLGWLFYLLSEIVPVTVVFIIVLVFNISFTSGTISGFILFSQLLSSFDLDASGIIKFSNSVKHKINEWAQIYLVLYGIFTLDFFNSESLSFCLMTKASALDMLAFKYVTILYTLLLIVAVIWVMNKFGGRCCGKYCRITTIKTSVIHGISSFLVICYTQCVQVSMNLLNPVHFKVEMDSGFDPPARVWLNAEIVYFTNRHLPYALPALFCLLTIGILPPALLLSYPLLNKVLAFLGCDNVNLFSHKLSISYLKPLLDSFQSCFKDNMRFFAGLYFLYRWLILLIYVITRSYSIYYTTVTGALLVILVIHTVFQPYVKRAHNIIDTLLFANLILISCLTFYNYHRNHYLRGVNHLTTISAAVLQLVLIYLPLIVLCVYILVTLCKKRKSMVLIASTTDKLVPERARKLRELMRSISTENKDDDSNEVELTHDQLMDEDVEYNANTCGYFKATSDTEMTLLNT